jgi:L-ascorbate metabolism protein UlaG (beta-lactamase superfamily)
VWVGHATVLVQMEGVAFITDPLFSQRCSPVQFMGPQRCAREGVAGVRVCVWGGGRGEEEGASEASFAFDAGPGLVQQVMQQFDCLAA